MTHFRFRHRKEGGHSHILCYVGPSEEATHALCGTLVMSHDECAHLMSVLQMSSHIVVIDEDVGGPSTRDEMRMSFELQDLWKKDP